MTLSIGDKAPSFTLPDHEGNAVSLADLLGKYVVIYFYPRALTPGCTLQACDLRDSYATLQKRGIKVIGVSADPSPLLKKFIEKESLNFTLVGDESHHTLVEYGVWKEKSMYGKRYFGVERTTYILNPQGYIAAVFHKVNPKTHLNDIMEWFPATK